MDAAASAEKGLVDAERFAAARKEILFQKREKRGIGTLKEKTLHAVLKEYLEPDKGCQEIRVDRYVADIKREDGIWEIQTQGFSKLRDKLSVFLKEGPVTVVYPIAETKWLYWINPETGELSPKRKSPKRGREYDVFFELYKIKMFLKDPNLKLWLVLMDMEEYKELDGRSWDKKRGASRWERIPLKINRIVSVESLEEYQKLIPEELSLSFTSKDYKKYSGLSLSCAQTALNVLTEVGAVRKVGKTGRLTLYERCGREEFGGPRD